MNFEKEAVPGVAVSTAPSLLYATLSASQTPVAAGAALERRRRGSGSGAGGSSSASGGGRDSPTHTTRHVSGYAVAEAISVIVETFFAGLAAAAEGSAEGGARTALPLSRYSLLVAEDDGTLADPDFPEIDPSVPITSVGVDKFVLVQRGAEPGASPRPGRAGEAAEGDVILLRVTIPQASIALRACEVGSGAAPSLLLTCYPPKDSGASSSFTVQLTGGGSARPLAGLAAPSQAGLAGLAAAEAAAGASLGAPP